MNITIISGSPREKSITKRVAIYLQNLLQNTTNHTVNMIEVRDYPLPPVEAVFSSVEKTPASFRTLASIMFATDAFILVTPEYNGSYSPAMKNLLDHFPKQHHKAFGIVTASPGAMGGIRASQQLLQLVPAVFGIASPYMLIVPQVDKKFNESGELTEPSFENAIHNFTQEFLWLAESLHPELIPTFKN